MVLDRGLRITSYFVAAVASVILANSTSAEVCTLAGVGEWTGACSYSGAPISGCDCDPGDHFLLAGEVEIPSGAIVSQDGFSTATGVQVVAGGSLSMRSGSVLRVNGAGLRCESGATCSFVGEYLSTADARLEPTPSDAGWWIVEGHVPCPDELGEEACGTGGNPGAVLLATSGTTTALSALQASIPPLGVEESGDVMWFGSSDPDDPREGSDTLFAYEVLRSDPTKGGLHFSVRQGTLDQDGYPLARREIAKFASIAPVEVGDHIVEITTGALPAIGYFDGRMLRWNGATRSFRIYASVRETIDCPSGAPICDLLKVAPREGFSSSHAVGSSLFIEYGWAPDDEFFVVRPARVVRATSVERDAPVILEGTTILRGVVFDRIQLLSLRTTPTLCRHVWIRDATNGNKRAVGIEAPLSCDGLLVTGGSERPTPDCGSGARDDCTHSIVAVTDGTISLSGTAIRHAGDDAFSIGAFMEPTVELDGFRVQYHSEHVNQSAQCVAGSVSSQERMIIQDLECIDASRDGPVLNPNRGSSLFEVDGMMLIANKHGVSSEDRNAVASDVENTSLRNVTVIGSQMQSSNGNALPTQTENFVVRRTSAPGGQIFNGAPGYARHGLITQNSHRNAVIVDDRWGDWSIELENIAWWGNQGTGHPFLVIAEPSDLSIVRSLFSHLGNELDPYEEFIRLRDGVEQLSSIHLDGLAFSDGQGEPMLDVEDRDSSVGDMDLSALCFWNNNRDASQPESLPSSTVSGVDPLFIDPNSGRLDVASGSPWEAAGCGVGSGADAPGVRGYRRIHAWSQLEPELMADDGDGDGVPEDSGVPNCLGRPAHGCADNCPGTFNPLQRDVDANGTGDACSPQCSNGIDDDHDGWIDYPADPDCSSGQDPVELPEPGVIPALAGGCLLLRRLSRRRP